MDTYTYFYVLYLTKCVIYCDIVSIVDALKSLAWTRMYLYTIRTELQLYKWVVFVDMPSLMHTRSMLVIRIRKRSCHSAIASLLGLNQDPYPPMTTSFYLPGVNESRRMVTPKYLCLLKLSEDWLHIFCTSLLWHLLFSSPGAFFKTT